MNKKDKIEARKVLFVKENRKKRTFDRLNFQYSKPYPQTYPKS
jgi:hypothetical protein